MFIGTYRTLNRLLSSLEDIPTFAARAMIGFMFAQAGYGKFDRGIEQTAQFFATLGIPAAQLQAPFVALVELVCGALLVIGLGTRLVALPLAATMVVAMGTAHREEITGLASLMDLTPFLYFMFLLLFATRGGGRFSADFFMSNRGI